MGQTLNLEYLKEIILRSKTTLMEAHKDSSLVLNCVYRLMSLIRVDFGLDCRDDYAKV